METGQSPSSACQKSIFDKLEDEGVSLPTGVAFQIFNLSCGSFVFGETQSAAKARKQKDCPDEEIRGNFCFLRQPRWQPAGRLRLYSSLALQAFSSLRQSSAFADILKPRSGTLRGLPLLAICIYCRCLRANTAQKASGRGGMPRTLLTGCPSRSRGRDPLRQYRRCRSARGGCRRRRGKFRRRAAWSHIR